MNVPPEYVIELAREAAMKSPCAKSKRGAVIFSPEEADRLATNTNEVFAQQYGTFTEAHRRAAEIRTVARSVGYNGQPPPFKCAGTKLCGEDCAKLCLHAEQRAILDMRGEDCDQLELVHVKVVDGQVVPSGGPSCWQCSRIIVEVGLAGVWLYEGPRGPRGPRGVAHTCWRFYDAAYFHKVTLASNGIVCYQPQPGGAP